MIIYIRIRIGQVVREIEHLGGRHKDGPMLGPRGETKGRSTLTDKRETAAAATFFVEGNGSHR